LDIEEQHEQVYLGVEVLSVPLSPALLRSTEEVNQETAVLVTAVATDSPAESAGLLPGDILLALDGQSVRDARLLPRLLNRGAARSGSRTLTILRAGNLLDLSLTPAARKAA
jgi:S1-C subfamily serine protease